VQDASRVAYDRIGWVRIDIADQCVPVA
jgi:hypothetical protein